MGILISRVGLLVFHFKSHINLRLPKCCFSFFFFFLKVFLFGSVKLGKPISYTTAQGIRKASQLDVHFSNFCMYIRSKF